jgi:hypothetical protein
MVAVGAAAKAGNATEATKLFFECVNGQPGGFDALPEASRAMHLDNAGTCRQSMRCGQRKES